jgi:hypothetical protein
MRIKLCGVCLFVFLSCVPVYALRHEKQTTPLIHVQASQKQLEDSYDNVFEQELQQEAIKPPSRVVVTLQSVGWYFFEWYLTLKEYATSAAHGTRSRMAAMMCYLKRHMSGHDAIKN